VEGPKKFVVFYRDDIIFDRITYLILRKINPAIYELDDTEGRIRGIFNIKHLKPYMSEENEELRQ
jgi:hypothetical protein